jgi:hypothetical protein
MCDSGLDHLPSILDDVIDHGLCSWRIHVSDYHFGPNESVNRGTSAHGLRHLPILRKDQSHLLANTIRTSYAASKILALASRVNVTRTRQHDNLAFRTLCIRK